ncbi:SUKH-4 family immunity protein [Streptomyces bugieae]|uniref:SUKH-4 family immunity protein n=1 Tax=Streptomyces bugieae TaxID=3098223 RepID=A0ABU7P0Q6_9ACTN|nr:SUKH-4 family immunity protein [Streptomyces sp. DSM 41528]
MVTFAQAQERAERWVNGEVPAELHRDVRVREFDLGFVAWAEDREGGPASEGGRARMVIARDSGETTLWPGLPVGEVIRRYEEEYGSPVDGGYGAAEPPPQRIDLEATSFLLTPPEWLQEAADAIGIPDRHGGAGSAGEGTGAGAGPAAPSVPHQAAAPQPSATPAPAPAPAPASGAGDDTPWAAADTTHSDAGGGDRSVGLPATVFAPPLAGCDEEDAPVAPRARPDAKTELLQGGSQLPRTQVAPALDLPSDGAGGPGAPLPPMPSAPPAVPGLPDLPPPSGPPVADVPPPPGVAAPGAPGPGTPPPAPRAAEPPAAGTGGTGAGPSGGPAAGAPAGGYVPTQLVSQLDADGLDLSAVDGPGGADGPGAGDAAGSGGTGAGGPGGGVHAAATMLADGASLQDLVGAGGAGGAGGPGGAGAGPGVPPPPSPPGVPGVPKPPGPPGRPGQGAHGAQGAQGGQGAPGGPPPPPPAPATGGASGGVHAAATMLASGAALPGGPGGPGGPGAPGVPPAAGPGVPPPGVPGPPQGQSAPPPGVPGPGGAAPGAYGYPPAPSGQPTVGPGYMAVLSYRAPDGSEQKIVRRSAPGTPHPEWQLLHELRGMNVPPQQVLELHTELECCDLPGGYCARMIRDNWPQVRISHTAAYGRDHASRQQGVRHLVEHQGELHQVADGPARPAPVRVPLPHPSQVPPVPPVPPQVIGQELEQSFGPQGIFRFDQRAVSRHGVPDVVAQMLVWAGLPVDFGPFFWAQAQPGRPVPTLAELAAERGVQPASDAGSYLVMGNDFGRQLCVQYGTANIVAVPMEAGPGGQPAAPQFVNSGLPEFVRCLAMLGRMWRLRYGLTPEQAGRWTVDFQAQLVALDPPALGSPETWWSVLLEQMWDGLL